MRDEHQIKTFIKTIKNLYKQLNHLLIAHNLSCIMNMAY